MPTKKVFGLVVGAIASVGVILYFQIKSPSHSKEAHSENTMAAQQERVLVTDNKATQPNQQNKTSDSPTPAVLNQNKGVHHSTHELTESSFEDQVGLCFRSEACELKEDPWQLYLKFKNGGRDKVTDSLISYLRKELQNPKYRDQYKDVLMRMIDDFYPLLVRDFQHAAYYYYLGDLDTSLKIYLDMEKKAAQDPNYPDPPKMNIANDFYDLHRWSEALVYYKKALDEALSEKQRGPDQQRAIHFIQDRISELERK